MYSFNVVRLLFGDFDLVAYKYEILVRSLKWLVFQSPSNNQKVALKRLSVPWLVGSQSLRGAIGDVGYTPWQFFFLPKLLLIWGE